MIPKGPEPVRSVHALWVNGTASCGEKAEKERHNNQSHPFFGRKFLSHVFFFRIRCPPKWLLILLSFLFGFALVFCLLVFLFAALLIVLVILPVVFFGEVLRET